MTGVQIVMARSRVLRLTLAAFATWCISQTTAISDVLNVFWLKRGVFWTLYPLLLMKLVIVTLLVAFSSALLLILVERPCTNLPKAEPVLGLGRHVCPTGQ